MPKRVKPAKCLTEVESAYLAGIVDGEGCVSASISRKGYINGCLEIGSVSRPLLEELMEMVGTGTICKKGRRSKRAKILYVWHVQIGAIPTLMPQLLPYLRLKRKQAELMLALATYSEFPSVISKEDRFQLCAIDELRRLNHRGEITLSN